MTEKCKACIAEMSMEVEEEAYKIPDSEHTCEIGKKKTEMAIISYVPLLMPENTEEAQIHENNFETVMKLLKRAEEVYNYVDTAAWTINKDVAFLIDRAPEIARHIEVWAEGMPKHWFKMYIMRDVDRYAMALMPNLEMSIKRNAELYKLQFGEELPKDAKRNIIFKPISFISTNNNTIHMLGDLPKELKVGFTDDVTLQQEPYYLGNGQKFELIEIDINDKELAKTDVYASYLAAMLEE